METRILTRWTSSLAERKGLLLATLEVLALDAVCAELGALQWAMALDTARASYALPAGDDRAAGRRRLSASALPLERLAAQLADRWDAADRETGAS